MKKIKIYITLSIVFFLVALSPQLIVKASDSYNYSSWGKAVPSAVGMIHKLTIDESSLGINFFEPKDIYVYNDYIYIIDGRGKDSNNTGELHGKIVKLNKNFQVESTFPSEDENSEFYYKDLEDKYLMVNPQGIFVNDDYILVADYGNNRLLKLTHDFEYIEEFNTPDDVFFTQKDHEYLPRKVVVDNAGRIYVIAKDAIEGIIELNSDGSFNRYTGTNKITVNPIEIFWNQFKTEEQRIRTAKYFPTTFNNLTLNKMGFIYATSNNDGETNNNAIQAINPKGIDVLKRNSFIEPVGDVVFPTMGEGSGPSTLIDISVNDYGLYSAIDSKRNRVFTFDEEGNLLYIFGSRGSQEGMFNAPVALTYYGEDILVLDQLNKNIVMYEPSNFGQLVNEASNLYYDGFYTESSDKWREVIKYNTNYEIAYIGIGKALYRDGKYKDAMESFKLGNDKEYYSKAYKVYRNEFVRDNFGVIMSITVVLIVLLFYKAIHNNIKIEAEEGKEG